MFNSQRVCSERLQMSPFASRWTCKLISYMLNIIAQRLCLVVLWPVSAWDSWWAILGKSLFGLC